MSSRKNSVPPAALEQYLRELPDCVVLRNEEDVFGHLQRGGDVDLLVGNLERAERTLIRHLGCPIRISRRSYVREYFYDWGNVDLLPSLEWRGACYLRTDSVFDGQQVSERGRHVPRLAHVALISWFSSLLWGGFFKERYAPEIRQAVESDGVAFRQALTEAAGNAWGERLWRMAADGHPEASAACALSLRRALWWRAFARSPLRTLKGYVSFVIRELSLRFKPTVPWIAIVGPDASRCSAVVAEIVDRFSDSPYAHAKAVSWQSPSSSSRSGLIRLVLAADWVMNYWTRWVHDRAKGCILAFDADHSDLFAGSWLDWSDLRPRLARRLAWLLPKLDLVFLLDSAPDGVSRHAGDDAPAGWGRQVHTQPSGIGELAAAPVLNGSLPPSVLAESIQRVLRAWMVDRTAASLDGARAPMMAASRASAEGSNGPR